MRYAREWRAIAAPDGFRAGRIPKRDSGANRCPTRQTAREGWGFRRYKNIRPLVNAHRPGGAEPENP